MESNGFDLEVFAKPLLQPRALEISVKRGKKKEKIDDTLLFDDSIGTSPIVVYRGRKDNYKITKKEFQETGASIDAVNLRIVLRDVAAGEKLYAAYVQKAENGRLAIKDWKARVDITSNNAHGRDLLVYALFEVQMAKDDMKQLKGYLPGHKTAATKKNTNNRIAECAARINHWLAVAIELDKARPEDETDSNDQSKAESEAADSPITVEDNAVSPITVRDDTPSPIVSREEFVTPKTSPVRQENKPKTQSSVLPINRKLKVPYESVRNDRPATPPPSVQRVRLRPPKPPTDADRQQVQNIESKGKLPAATKLRRKRKVIEEPDDSDGEFWVEDDIKPVRREVKRRKNPKR